MVIDGAGFDEGGVEFGLAVGIVDPLGGAVVAGGDGGACVEECFEDDFGGGVVVSGVDECVGGEVEGVHFGGFADEADVGGEVELFGLLLVFGVGGAGDDEFEIGVGGECVFEGDEEWVVAFEAGVHGDEEEDGVGGGEAEGFACEVAFAFAEGW